MYPLCNDCGHTRAEHGVGRDTTQLVFPCSKTDCQCANYVPMTDWEKKVAMNEPAVPAEPMAELETRTYWVEIDSLDEETVEFAWPGINTNPMLSFKVSIDRGSWVKLKRPSHLKVVMVEERLS